MSKEAKREIRNEFAPAAISFVARFSTAIFALVFVAYVSLGTLESARQLALSITAQ
jgi:hypothetical protein